MNAKLLLSMLLTGLFSLVSYAQDTDLKKLESNNRNDNQTILKISDAALAYSLPYKTQTKSLDFAEIARIDVAGGRMQTVETAVPQEKEKNPCPDTKKLRNLCSSINMLDEDKDPNSPYVYLYQRLILEAACVDSLDTPIEMRRKVNELWNNYPADFLCKNITGFDVNPGNVLKLAVRNKFKSFLVDAAQVWKVNLNQVDEADSRTVLDYVVKEIQRYKNTEDEAVIKNYYDILRKAGAKHKSEL